MFMLICFIIFVIFTCFAIPGFFGAPYVPTLSKNMKTALDMLDLKPGQTMIELGCGDGKVVVAAAQRGWNVVGYELNPLLAAIAWVRTIRYRKQVTIVWGNFFTKELPSAEGVFCFVMPKFMPEVSKKLTKSYKKIKVASFAFAIPGIKPVAQKDNVFLYNFK